DPRDQQRAVPVAGPATGHAQPGLAVGRVAGFPLPVETHLDAALGVAVDVLARRSADHRALAAEQARLGMLRAQPVGAVPGGGEKLVAVAGLAFSRLSSHL